MRPEGNTGDPLRLVVSGGIGSGKSTVLRIVQTLDVYVIEADAAPEESRRRRAIARGLTETDVSRRMAAQPASEELLAGGNIVLDNSGRISELEAGVVALLGRLRGGVG